MKKKVSCPVCGNEILAGSERGRQRCRFCKRQYIVSIEYGSEPKKNIWTLEEVATGHLTKHDVKMLNDFEDSDKEAQLFERSTAIKPVKQTKHVDRRLKL